MWCLWPVTVLWTIPFTGAAMSHMNMPKARGCVCEALCAVMHQPLATTSYTSSADREAERAPRLRKDQTLARLSASSEKVKRSRMFL